MNKIQKIESALAKYDLYHLTGVDPVSKELYDNIVPVPDLTKIRVTLSKEGLRPTLQDAYDGAEIVQERINALHI